MTKEQLAKHIASVAGGPRSEDEVANAERVYQERVNQGRAELEAAKWESRRAPGAPPTSRFAALRAAMPSFSTSIADLPEIPEVEPLGEPQANGNGRSKNPPLDREMLESLGRLWQEVKKGRGRAYAWEEVVEALMVNLPRLVPGFGTLKDVLTLARQLDEYSNPAPSRSGGRKDNVTAYRKALLMEGEEEE